MAVLNSSGSASVTVTSGAGVELYGPWTAMFMGTDQATHGTRFDSSWMMVTAADNVPVGAQNGRQHTIQIGKGPVSPPSDTIWENRFMTFSAGGGRGAEASFSFPIKLAKGEFLWCRQKDNEAVARDLGIFITSSDQVAPIQAANAHFSTEKITSGATPGGVLFGANDVLGLWYIMGRGGVGSGMPLPFNASWMSIMIGLINVATETARWQLAATPLGDPGPPALPELIDMGFQTFGAASNNISYLGDVKNFPIPWTRNETIWIRGANAGVVARTFTIGATFFGNT